MKAPEVGPHLEGLRTSNEGNDPPPEDPGNAGGASQVAVSWKRWPTMWPQGGSETSPTSSTAVGQPRWSDMKELMPLQFMPYMAKLFREVTGKDLQGLDQFTGWIGLGGYYHWRVAQQGLLHLVPCLQGQRTPRTPDAHPSG